MKRDDDICESHNRGAVSSGNLTANYMDSLSVLELGAELVSAEVSELDPDEDELEDELELDDEDELLDDLDDPLLVLICCIC